MKKWRKFLAIRYKEEFGQEKTSDLYHVFALMEQRGSYNSNSSKLSFQYNPGNNFFLNPIMIEYVK